MATLTVWCYPTPLGARAGAVRLRLLVDLGALELIDAAAVTWAPGSHRPRVASVRRVPGPPPARVSVLVTLFTILTDGDPRAGSEAVVRSVAERLVGTGLDEGFLAEALDRLAPGCSCLLVLSGQADLDVVVPAVAPGLARGEVSLLHAVLPDDAPDRIRRALAVRDE